MENEGIKIVTGDKEKVEVILRKVDKVNELPVKPPIKVDIVGTLGAPYEFLSKRIDQPDQINQKKCFVLVDRKGMDITLITNEDNEYWMGRVIGKLKVHPKIIDFGINTEKEWEPNELGQFFKMNRAYFTDKTKNMELVTILKNFQAKIESKIEKQKADDGKFADSFSGVVSSNLPDGFKVNLPIFKGSKPEEFEVEFYSKVNGRTIFLQLVSPGAQEVMDNVKDNAIDVEIAKIRELAPDIAIIEK